ncbi:MAG: cgmA, partial [Paenibacillaceae bacterium]|nr:cgmA [Paenibacillaceae bacterium]
MTHPHKAGWPAQTSSPLKRAATAVFRHAWFRFVRRRISLLILPFLLVFLTEALTRRGWSQAFAWITEHPNEFALNCWIAFFATLAAAALTGRTRASSILLLLTVAILGIWSGISMNRTGLPLLPWRIMLPGREADPVAALNPSLTSGLLAAAAGTAAALVLAFLTPGTRMGARERLLYAAAGLFFLVSVYLDCPVSFTDYFRITLFHYEEEASYNRNGFGLSTLDNLHFVAPVRPAG